METYQRCIGQQCLDIMFLYFKETVAQITIESIYDLYIFTVCFLSVYTQESVPSEAGSVIRCVYAAEAHLLGDGVHGARLSPQLHSAAPRFLQPSKSAQHLPRCQPGHAVPGGEPFPPPRSGQYISMYVSIKKI